MLLMDGILPKMQYTTSIQLLRRASGFGHELKLKKLVCISLPFSQFGIVLKTSDKGGEAEFSGNNVSFRRYFAEI